MLLLTGEQISFVLAGLALRVLPDKISYLKRIRRHPNYVI